MFFVFVLIAVHVFSSKRSGIALGTQLQLKDGCPDTVTAEQLQVSSVVFVFALTVLFEMQLQARKLPVLFVKFEH